MQRWGYIVIDLDPTTAGPKSPRSDWMIRATPKGQPQAAWRPLFGHIEDRRRRRFGQASG